MKNSTIVKLGSMDNAVLFVKICNKYKDVNIDYSAVGSRYIVDAKSIMGVLSTSINRKAEVCIYTDDDKIIEKFKRDIKDWIVEGN